MKKTTKKLLCLYLCAILLCGVFSGCGNSNQQNVDIAAQTYIDMAQEYIDNGNYSSAIDILRKGYSSTGDERINALLQDVLSSQTTNSTTNTTVPSVTEPPVTEPPVTESPVTEPPVTEPPVTEPPVTEPPTTEPSSSSTFLYTHSGTISINSANIALQDSAVLYVTLSYAGSVSYSCEPNNIVTLSWGEFDYSNTAPLYITALQNGTARIRIYETNYPDNYLTVNVTVSNHVTIDTSTASGILASMGLTEAEFRILCQRLFTSNIQIGTTNGNEVYFSDLFEYPNMYINQIFAIDNLSGYDCECTYKGTSDDGYPYYECTDYYDGNAVIYDFRDDPYFPNIQKGDAFTPYVIFKGIRTRNGIDWLVFWMISVDKQ